MKTAATQSARVFWDHVHEEMTPEDLAKGGFSIAQGSLARKPGTIPRRCNGRRPDFEKWQHDRCPQGTDELLQYWRCQAPHDLAPQMLGEQYTNGTALDPVRHAFDHRTEAPRRGDGGLNWIGFAAVPGGKSAPKLEIEDMDINQEYAAHQHAMMRADRAACEGERIVQLTRASSIAGRISRFQRGLGAASASAWNRAELSAFRPA